MTDENKRLPKARSVLGIIPARGGSKGLPGKNIAMLHGFPLLSYTIRAAQESQLLEHVVLSTDSEEIAAVARQFGMQVPWLRPATLAGDRARVQDAVEHVLSIEPDAARYQYLMLLQPTAPLRVAEDIDAAIRLAFESGACSVVSMTIDDGHHPYLAYQIEMDTEGRERAVALFDTEPGLPRQAFPTFAYRNGAVYLVRRDYFLRNRSFVSDDCVPYMMPAIRSANIDSDRDLAYAEFLLQQSPSGMGGK